MVLAKDMSHIASRTANFLPWRLISFSPFHLLFSPSLWLIPPGLQFSPLFVGLEGILDLSVNLLIQKADLTAILVFLLLLKP